MSLTVLFMPESAYGPTNNCIGIGDVLRRRGHRVVFAAEASWAGKLTALGFEEDLVDLAPAPDEPLAPEGPGSSAPSVGPGAGSSTDAGQFWKDFIRDTAPEFRKPTIEQLETWVKPVWQELIDGAKFCQPQLLEIIERVKPDVIVEDNVVAFPALNTAGVPFVRIVSCNPLEKKGPDIAPVFSGYPAASREGWADFLAEYDRTHRPMWEQFNDWVVEQGAPALPDLEFIHEGALNLYVYPRVLDYTDRRRLAPTWKRLESSVRETDAEWKLPDGFVDEHRADGRKLIYFSLGSLGSADVELMERLIAALARTDHRYIVSKGPLHEEITLADNMIGAEFLPQTTIMPLVDLVITHGGNNTTTEAMHFGKPMVVLPLFWDQYDNAQRVHERGYGVRLDTYGFTDEQLHAAIERLLGDAELRDRLAKDAAEIRAADGLRVAADAIERLGPAGK